MKIARRLNIGEGQLYRSIRLEALRESPDAFSSRYADAFERSDESWDEQANSSATGSDRATFIAVDEKPVGLVALYRDKTDSDVGELLQMWVAPEKRGGFVAVELLTDIFQWAASNQFIAVKAEVMSANTRALKFYQKFGFVISSKDFSEPESTVVMTKKVEQ